MPKLTWTMEEGIVGEWHRRAGDSVDRGDILCEIETEKSVDELKAPESGILGKIIFPKGSVVKVNEVIAIIVAPGESMPEENVVEAREMQIVTKPAEEIAVPIVPPSEESKISPVARKLAEEYRIDPKQIQGTGPDGRIVKEDVLRVAEKTTQSRILPLSHMREVIKNRLTLSVKNALHVPLTIEVDMTTAVRLMEDSRLLMEERYKSHPTATDLLVKTVAKSLEKHPILNARFVGEQIEIPQEVNIGVAVTVENGLVVPVVHDANKKTLIEVMKEMAGLAQKARAGTLSTAESAGGTFTVSNLGMFGIDFFAPIINPPESAILGVGRIVKKPVAIEDEIVLRSMMTLTLVFDHRIMDGAVAAKFLETLKEKLEKPAGLFNE